MLLLIHRLTTLCTLLLCVPPPSAPSPPFVKVGGYAHNALGDLTGFAPLLHVFKQGHQGYNPVPGRGADASLAHQAARQTAVDEAEFVWRRLRRYLGAWRGLAGCSIQPHPATRKSKTLPAAQQAAALPAFGLQPCHAYGLLGLAKV